MPDNATDPLHALRPTTRFSDRAADYAKVRPSYPAPAIDAVLDGLGDPAAITCADVGAGTGISARLLGDRGVRVIAIEPNAAMRAEAAPHPRVEWREATAEATGLGDRSVDLVVCAQAFHWFRPEQALAEFARVLRRPGRVALVWNIRDECDAFTKKYGELIDAVSTFCSATTWGNDVPALRASPHFQGVRLLRFPYQQVHDADGLVRRAMSASYVPKEGERAEWLRRELGGLHAQHADAAGMVRVAYVTEVYLAEAVG